MGRYLSPTQWLRWTLSYPIEEQGHSPSQWVLWTLSYPVHEAERPAELPGVLNTHPLQAASQLQMLYLSTSNNVAIFRVPIKVATRERFVATMHFSYRFGQG